MNESMDRLLAYRNFLAAEDHLDELLYSPHNQEEQIFLDGVKEEIEQLRSVIMPEEVNKEYHCLVKHVATAYEACREVHKASELVDDLEIAKRTQTLLYELLEHLWGRKIVNCERCGVKEEQE